MKLNDRIENSRYVQYGAALSATLSMAACAMYNTWASPSLPKLTSNNTAENPIGEQITTEDGSWIASSLLLGSLPGCVIAFWVVEKFGRKKSVLFTAFPLLAGWIIVYFAKSVILICAARFMAGAAMGVVTTGCSIYNGEIAEKDIRGKLGTFFNIMKLIGNFIVLAIGPFVSYDVLNIICAVLPILFFCSFVTMPESPYFLMRVGRRDEAKKELIRLSSNNVTEEFIDKQLEEIAVTVENDMKNRTTLWEFLSNIEYRRSIIVIFGIKTLQQLSGTVAIEAYMQTIIEKTGSSISPEVSSILFGAIQFPAAFIAAGVVDKMGRKPLLIVSSAGCAVALVGEGIYFYLQDVAKSDVSSLSWLPTSGIMLFLLMSPVGIFTLPYVLLGEIFPTNIKGIAVSVATIYGSLLSFLVSKYFAPLSELWGVHVVFWLYAGVCVLGIVFIVLMLPETKGKTFADIQIKLNRHLSRKDNEKLDVPGKERGKE